MPWAARGAGTEKKIGIILPESIPTPIRSV